MNVTEEDVTRVDTVLQPLREGFAEDGASLAVDSTEAGIRVRLVLTDESCADCIVGPEILRAIVTGQLADAGVTLPVTVVDPRE
jgi:hypothetical protein